MSRVIKFRGKATLSIGELNEREIEHKKGWVYGNLITNGGSPFIFGDIADHEEGWIAPEFWVSVIPESVGQFTNLHDRNGLEIWEGDIWEWDRDTRHIIEFDEDRAGWYPFADDDGCGCCSSDIYDSAGGDVIGNIHDNPELLEVTR